MISARWLKAVAPLLLGTLLVVSVGGTPRSDQQQPQKQPAKQTIRDEIIQEFAGEGDQKTAWKVHFKAGSPRPGLMITGAWFKTGPKTPWFLVAGELRLSEIFVPYNNGTTRLYDIGAQGNYDLMKHSQADAGPNGQLLNDALVVQELRDTGVLWKYYDKVRRGQELVLWSTISAANYNYIVEFAFRCDGNMTCRLGSAGKNLGNHETMGHMHHACWRLDLNIGDKNHNSVSMLRRSESKDDNGKAEDKITALTTECGLDWNPEEFTRLRVESKLKNALGNPISYELIPLRPGTPRHFGPDEEFTAHDFWVTPYKFDELYYAALPKYIKKGRKIDDTDVVVWCMSTAYHLPRDEDGLFVNPRGEMEVRGVAMTTWCGLEMRPRNLFDKSPLYP